MHRRFGRRALPCRAIAPRRRGRSMPRSARSPGTLVRRADHDGGCDAGAVRLEPPRRAYAPLVSRLEPVESPLGPRCREVVARPAAEGQELLRHHRADRVTPDVVTAGGAAAVPEESGHGIGRARLQLAADDVAIGVAVHTCTLPVGSRGCEEEPHFAPHGRPSAAVVAIALATQFGHGRRSNGLQAENFFSYFTVLSNCAAVVLLAFLVSRPALAYAPGFLGRPWCGDALHGRDRNRLRRPARARIGRCRVDDPVGRRRRARARADLHSARLARRPAREEAPRPPGRLWLIFPAVYLVYSLCRGPIADWYPYPFLDPDHGSLGYWNVAITSVGILITIVVSRPAAPAGRVPWRRLSPWTQMPSRSGCSVA